MKRLLLTLTAMLTLMLYPSERASAIGIMMDPRSSVTAYALAPNAGPVVSSSVLISNEGTRLGATVRSVSPITDGESSATGEALFFNSATSTISFLDGSTLLMDRGLAEFANKAAVEISFLFTLTETVDYSLISSILAHPAEGNTFELFAEIVQIGSGIIYRDSDMITDTASTLVLDSSGSGTIGSNTGTLGPGSYQLTLLHESRDGRGGSFPSTGRFELMLTASANPMATGGGASVSDAGSTMMLMAVALSMLGGITQLKS